MRVIILRCEDSWADAGRLLEWGGCKRLRPAEMVVVGLLVHESAECYVVAGTRWVGAGDGHADPLYDSLQVVPKRAVLTVQNYMLWEFEQEGEGGEQ